MNRKAPYGVLCVLAVLAAGFSSVSAAERIKKEKLQVFLMLGQLNMVGPADVSTLQYLLQGPYKPSFEECKDDLRMRFYYRRIYSDYGYELEQKMRRDPEYFTMHPRALRGLIRKAGPEYKTSQPYARWERFKGISNRGCHYMDSAEFSAEGSDAFASAMVELMKKQ